MYYCVNSKYIVMKPATSFDELYRQMRLRKISFFTAFFIVVFVTYTFLYAIDFIPEPVGHDDAERQTNVTVQIEKDTIAEITTPIEKEEKNTPVTATDPLPTKIFIDKLNREVAILNPTEATIPAMDAALLKGIVRHPDSADFQKTGNMLLLGHSSYLPNVLNKNFQAFNGIQKLTWGDTIRVQSGDTEYIYRVDKVHKESATDVVVPYDWGTAKLTLVTCNVYGAKEDRFIVEAVLVSTKLL